MPTPLPTLGGRHSHRQWSSSRGSGHEEVIHENFNLEEFIGKCKDAIVENDNPYWGFMTRYLHNKIKLDFMKAVTEIVTGEVRSIYQEKNEGIYLLISQFLNFFTLNYDPFLYQLLMTYKKDKGDQVLVFQESLPGITIYMDTESREVFDIIRRAHESGVVSIAVADRTRQLDLGKLSKTDFKKEISLYLKERYTAKEINKAVEVFWKTKNADKPKVVEPLDDGFRLFGGELTFSNPRTQNLFFLHGAFHLYHRGESIYKITQENEKALYEKIQEIVESPEKDILCVLSDIGKLGEIQSSNYLKKSFEKLAVLSGALVIIGSSLAENDRHIFDEISKSEIRTIYISSSTDSAKRDLENASKLFPGKKLVLFDRETVTYAKTGT